MIKDSPEESLNTVNSFLVSVGNNLAQNTLTKLNATNTDLAKKNPFVKHSYTLYKFNTNRRTRNAENYLRVE